MLRQVQRILNHNDWELSRLSRIIERMNTFAPEIQALSDVELNARTFVFRTRISNGEPLYGLLPEAFAVVREAVRRVLGLLLYDEQLLAAAALFRGDIADMKTGEGKTLASIPAGYVHALTGKGVHIVTANEYLAVRDSTQLQPVYQFLGLSVGCTLNGMARDQKRRSYACDLTYGTASEFGFDYLHDHLSLYSEQLVQRPLHYAVIDEVDSILIDEARTPLVISGKGQRPSMLYYRMNRFILPLSEGFDFTIDLKAKTLTLTELCVRKAEREFMIDNLFDPEHSLIHHHLIQALRAHHLIRREIEYIVKDNAIQLIDTNTGRLMPGRRYSDGLHQAIEEKEGVHIGTELVPKAAMTLQHYFAGYPKLAGMTGTAVTEHNEFRRVYGLHAVQIPTRLPCIRDDLQDLIYLTEAAKNGAIICEVLERHANGQPVLIGTVSIEKSEQLSVLLQEAGVPHRVLNAHRHAEEAEIIAGAGRKGAVTIATNMAGRGTDIQLGEGSAETGGLHVIGTERHESRRIDQQLRGRSGRQGDPGSSRFFLSLEDSLFQRFGSDSLRRKMLKLGHDESSPLEGKLVSLSIESAQHVVEGIHYDTLLHVIQYDDVVNRQQKLIYRDREDVLLNRIDRDLVAAMLGQWCRSLVTLHCPEQEIPEEWNTEGLQTAVNPLLDPDLQINAADLRVMEQPQLRLYLTERLSAAYSRKETALGSLAMRNLEKYIILNQVDRQWMEHLDAMDQLREGIHLRAYSGNDPFQEYQFEGHEMFLALIRNIGEAVCSELLRVKISPMLHSGTEG
ncbi:preprotein translocase subunit SecA [Paenibacillus sp. FSL R7-0331]|uniref:preprotein translocase subunit SecA n=1 Tax=Paenibacillus sp. FSL R7-0331 TaxID=1536773 RepID=UPI0005A9EE14|nr:preprotein translocase subunit SecA [Paenibacillus sp. FSL R7-0331]